MIGIGGLSLIGGIIYLIFGRSEVIKPIGEIVEKREKPGEIHPKKEKGRIRKPRKRKKR
jgi:hypothetical protein